MATKPTLANARFGETAGAVVSGTLVAPLSGTRDTGFVASTPAASGQVSALLHEAYLWFKYISDGVFDGDITCTNLHVLGDADIDDDLNVDGDAQIDLTLNVGGNGTFGGYVDADAHYFTQDQFLVIPAAAAANPGGVHGLNTGATWWVMQADAGAIVWPVRLPAGAIITGYTVYINKGSGVSYTTRLIKTTSAFADSTVTSSTASTTSTGNLTLSPGVLNEPTSGTDSYSIQITSAGPNFNGSDKVGTAVVTWTYPHP